MSDFKSLNGYLVKDEVARQQISEETKARELAISDEAEARAQAIAAETQVRNKVISDEAEARIKGDENTIKYPKLTQEQKTAFYDLMNGYYRERTKFEFTDDCYRNYFADSSCLNDAGKIKLNCSMFAQLIWAGVSIDTFSDMANYDATLTKAFDWGYEFKFASRKAYKKYRDENTKEPYGFVKPKSDTYERSYSYNTVYSDNGDATFHQKPRLFVQACDMAQELYYKGYEIPISEAERGDLIFFRDTFPDDNKSDMLAGVGFRNITHCGIVVGKFSDGLVSFYECSDFYTDTIITTNLNSEVKSNYVRAASMLSKCVMVARHPVAYGKTGNVGDKFTLY